MFKMMNFVLNLMNWARRSRVRGEQGSLSLSLLRIAQLMATFFFNLLLKMHRLWRISPENDDFRLEKRPFIVQFAVSWGRRDHRSRRTSVAYRILFRRTKGDHQHQEASTEPRLLMIIVMVRVEMLSLFVYTCRRLIDLSSYMDAAIAAGMPQHISGEFWPIIT